MKPPPKASEQQPKPTMNTISQVIAREIFDSRGNPTVEVEVLTRDGFFGRAAVPSGASTGQYEAVELRDGEKNRLQGKGVQQAVRNVNHAIAERLVNTPVTEQRYIDVQLKELDATDNYAKLGANAVLGVSMAVARAAAASVHLPLYRYLGGAGSYVMPVPMMNILNGGKHADNQIDFQEFMVMPLKAGTFREALTMGVEVFHQLKKLLSDQGYTTNVGDEGGFAPNLKSNEEAIEFVIRAIEAARYKPGEEIAIALDAASSEMWDEQASKYRFFKSDQRLISGEELIAYWKAWTSKYPIVSIEDGLHEDDWKHWSLLQEALGQKVQLVGDDLFVTNVKRLQKGIDEKAANSILIKLNQIGTLSETIDAVQLANKHRMTAVISHRSGETEDSFIADLAVGLNTGQIKTGSASRSDRMAKYNQLLRIEEDLSHIARYDGPQFPYA